MKLQTCAEIGAGILAAGTAGIGIYVLGHARGGKDETASNREAVRVCGDRITKCEETLRQQANSIQSAVSGVEDCRKRASHPCDTMRLEDHQRVAAQRFLDHIKAFR